MQANAIKFDSTVESAPQPTHFLVHSTVEILGCCHSTFCCLCKLWVNPMAAGNTLRDGGSVAVNATIASGGFQRLMQVEKYDHTAVQWPCQGDQHHSRQRFVEALECLSEMFGLQVAFTEAVVTLQKKETRGRAVVIFQRETNTHTSQGSPRAHLALIVTHTASER